MRSKFQVEIQYKISFAFLFFWPKKNPVKNLWVFLFGLQFFLPVELWSYNRDFKISSTNLLSRPPTPTPKIYHLNLPLKCTSVMCMYISLEVGS